MAKKGAPKKGRAGGGGDGGGGGGGTTSTPTKAPGPNEPCDCGSGKKYKKCCALKKVLRKATAVQGSPSLSQGQHKPVQWAFPTNNMRTSTCDLALGGEMRDRLMAVGLTSATTHLQQLEGILVDAQKVGFRELEVDTLCMMNDIYEEKQQCTLTLKQSTHALAIIATLEDSRMVERSFHVSLVFACMTLSMHGDAVLHAKMVLSITEELYYGDPMLTAQSECCLGMTFMQMGEFDQAVEHLEPAAKLMKVDISPMIWHMASGIAQFSGAAVEVQRLTTRILGTLATCLKKLGRYEEAININEEALGQARANGDIGLEAAVLGNLGSCYAGVGRFEQAMKYRKESLAMHTRLGLLVSVTIDQGNIGYAYGEAGQFAEAIEFTAAAIATAKKIGDFKREQMYRAQMYRLSVETAVEKKGGLFDKDGSSISVSLTAAMQLMNVTAMADEDRYQARKNVCWACGGGGASALTKTFVSVGTHTDLSDVTNIGVRQQRKVAGMVPLLQCGGCKVARYCGKDCAKKHWKSGHKLECKRLSESRKDDVAEIAVQVKI
jgi:tetratricopeptide (TPR) repeat protein